MIDHPAIVSGSSRFGATLSARNLPKAAAKDPLNPNSTFAWILQEDRGIHSFRSKRLFRLSFHKRNVLFNRVLTSVLFFSATKVSFGG